MLRTAPFKIRFFCNLHLLSVSNIFVLCCGRMSAVWEWHQRERGRGATWQDWGKGHLVQGENVAILNDGTGAGAPCVIPTVFGVALRGRPFECSS